MSAKKIQIGNNNLWGKIFPYLLAGLAVVITSALLVFVRNEIKSTIVPLFLLLPVLVSTTLWGLGPGILSALLIFLSYNFFFLKPYGTFSVHDPQDIFALGIFLIVAVLISQLVGRAKKGMQAAMAREQESTQLYELSMGLAGGNNLKEIALVIAQKTLGTFQAGKVEIVVEPVYGQPGFRVEAGGEQEEIQPAYSEVVPLETARGFIGKAIIWRKRNVFTPVEQRLLRTYATQGALALERAALEQAETRAQVLEESDRFKSSLLSSVSHEFRTPLATIKASITSLLGKHVDWDSEARQELLTAVDEETDLLDHLVGNLLNMSKIESGALHPNRQWNLLPEIVDGVIARMHRLLRRHILQVEIVEDLPLIPVDYVQMEQVFTNLLSNSAKYAPEGSTILIRAFLNGADAIRIQVTNQGPLVAQEHLDRIFDKFYRVTNSEKVSGTGLGLSICKGIIEAHGGKIWAENRAEGFTFMIEIPLIWNGARPPVIEPEIE